MSDLPDWASKKDDFQKRRSETVEKAKKSFEKEKVKEDVLFKKVTKQIRIRPETHDSLVRISKNYSMPYSYLVEYGLKHAIDNHKKILRGVKL